VPWARSRLQPHTLLLAGARSGPETLYRPVQKPKLVDPAFLMRRGSSHSALTAGLLQVASA
jgi:hypothetical protein